MPILPFSFHFVDSSSGSKAGKAIHNITVSSEMYRTASTTRISDEYSVNMSPAAGSNSKGSPLPKLPIAADEYDAFHIQDPILDAAKKESPRRTPGERTVHLIPLVLVICALILWLFSEPVSLYAPSPPA